MNARLLIFTSSMLVVAATANAGPYLSPNDWEIRKMEIEDHAIQQCYYLGGQDLANRCFDRIIGNKSGSSDSAVINPSPVQPSQSSKKSDGECLTGCRWVGSQWQPMK